MKYLTEKKPTDSLFFRIFHLVVIVSLGITLISLLSVGVLTGTPAYQGNTNLEIAMTALQTIEPLLMISALLLMFKGKRNFYFFYMGAQVIVMTTNLIQSMWMGVIRSGIIIITSTWTYYKWGKETGDKEPLVVKKADGKIWAYIIIGLTVLAVAPGLTLQFIPEDSIFKPQTLALGWLDSVAFAGTITALVLTTYKYREARLIAFGVAFIWPFMFFSTGVWLFGTNSIFFWFVSLVGLAQWYYRAQFSPEEQKKMV